MILTYTLRSWGGGLMVRLSICRGSEISTTVTLSVGLTPPACGHISRGLLRQSKFGNRHSHLGQVCPHLLIFTGVIQFCEMWWLKPGFFWICQRIARRLNIEFVGRLHNCGRDGMSCSYDCWVPEAEWLHWNVFCQSQIRQLSVFFYQARYKLQDGALTL